MDAQLDYGRLLLKAGRKVDSETLLIGYFADARLGLEAYADAVAQALSDQAAAAADGLLHLVSCRGLE